MLHFGDITQIDVSTIPPVEIITGGSPCQDLSVAGKRAGLAGKRSGLYMEQIRIIREMRKRDEVNGRTGQSIRPRYMVWENVPGAFSSNGGEDFRAVLEEAARIVDPNAAIPRPPKGAWRTSGAIVGDGWSLAWRVFNAQFWGVPQRRRRIALVVDFGGGTAPEILFERKSLPGDTAPGPEAGQGAAAAAEGGVNPAVAHCLRGRANFSHREDSETLIVQTAVPKKTIAPFNRTQITIRVNRSAVKDGDPSPALCSSNEICVVAGFSAGQGAKAGSIGYREEVSPTIRSAGSGTNQTPCLCIQGNFADREVKQNGAGVIKDLAYTLNATDRHCVFDARSNGKGEISPTLAGDHNRGISDYAALVMSTGQSNTEILQELSPCLNCNHEQPVVASADCRNGYENPELSGTLQAKENGGQSLNYVHPIRLGSVVRRLTPLECERLQGFPDGWTDIGPWTDSKGKYHRESNDSARYKALGNSIAIPVFTWILSRISDHLDKGAALGSLFDGIGGFPLIWERIHGKGTALWASEIEDFPIAVTKYHFREIK